MRKLDRLMEDVARLTSALHECSEGCGCGGTGIDTEEDVVDEDPQSPEEVAHLELDLKSALGFVITDSLGRHLAREYEMNPEGMTPDRVMAYMGQVQDVVERVLNDRAFLQDTAKEALSRALDRIHHSIEPEIDEDDFEGDDYEDAVECDDIPDDVEA